MKLCDGPARCRDQTTILRTREGYDGATDLVNVAHIDGDYLYPERGRRGLDHAELGDPRGGGWIAKDRYSRYVRRDLFEQFHPLPAQAIFECHEPGGIAAWPRQAVDEASANRVADDWENNRHRTAGLQQRTYGRGTMGQDDIGRERGQFSSMSANVGGIRRGPAR